MKYMLIILIILFIGMYVFYYRHSSSDKVVEAFLRINDTDFLKPQIESVRKWLFTLYSNFSELLPRYIVELWSFSEFEKVKSMDRKWQKMIIENIAKNDFFSNI